MNSGHFKCKKKDAKIYKQLTELHNSNTIDVLLRQLNHGYDTQGVEAMNKSCSAYANKGETFSKSMSLTTRLEIACSVQILGHHELWRRIYGEMGLRLGDSMEKYLMRKYKDKQKKQSIGRQKRTNVNGKHNGTKNTKF